MAFRIGQKVVCVDDSPDRRGVIPDRLLRKGRVYTVAGFDSRPPDALGDTGVFLEEAMTPDPASGYGWSVRRFRPVTEQKRKTSISIFKEILDRENHGLPSRVDYPADCEPK